MKIYMTDIVPFGDEKIFAQMLPFITEDRKNKIMQLKKKRRPVQIFSSRIIVRVCPEGIWNQSVTRGKCSRCILDSERKENRY